MKPIFLIPILMLCFAVKAQQPDSMQLPRQEINMADEDTVRLKFDKIRILVIAPKDDSTSTSDTSKNIEKPSSHKYWAGFDLGVNGMMQNGGFKTPSGIPYLDQNYGKSISIGLHIAEWKLPIYKEYVGFVTGLGFQWDSYAFKNNYRLQPGQNTLTAVIDSGAQFSRNKLKASYVVMPLMLAFGTSEKANKGLHFAAGVEVGYRFNTKLKIHQEDAYSKVYDDFNLNPWKANAIVRMSVKNFKVWASYGLTTLFVKGQGPDLVPFNAGVTLFSL